METGRQRCGRHLYFQGVKNEERKTPYTYIAQPKNKNHSFRNYDNPSRRLAVIVRWTDNFGTETSLSSLNKSMNMFDRNSKPFVNNRPSVR